MVLPPRLRRQRPGIRVQQTTISLGEQEMDRLRKEAFARKVTLSLHIRDLVRFAWATKDEEAA